MTMKNQPKTFARLPDAELELMLALWDAGRPMKALELCEALSETREWRKATVQVLLGRLCERGFVCAENERNYKLYRPLVSEEEYRASASSSLMHKLCRGKVSTLVASLIAADALEESDLDELEALLAAGREGKHDEHK